MEKPLFIRDLSRPSVATDKPGKELEEYNKALDERALNIGRPDLLSSEGAKKYKLDFMELPPPPAPTWGTSVKEAVTLFPKEAVNGITNMAMVVPEAARYVKGWAAGDPNVTFNPAKWDVFDTSGEKTWSGTVAKLAGNFFGAGLVLNPALRYGSKALRAASTALGGSPNLLNPKAAVYALVGKKHAKTVLSLIKGAFQLEFTTQMTLTDVEAQKEAMLPKLFEDVVNSDRIKDSKIKHALQTLASNIRYYTQNPTAVRLESGALGAIFNLALSGAARRTIAKQFGRSPSEIDQIFKDADALTGDIEKVNLPPFPPDLPPFPKELPEAMTREQALAKALNHYKGQLGEESWKTLDDILEDLIGVANEGRILRKQKKAGAIQEMMTDLAVLVDSPIDKLYLNLLKIRHYMQEGGPEAAKIIAETPFFKNLEAFMDKYGGFVSADRRAKPGSFKMSEAMSKGERLGEISAPKDGPFPTQERALPKVASPMEKPSRDLRADKAGIKFGKTLEYGMQTSSPTQRGDMTISKGTAPAMEQVDSTAKTMADKGDTTLGKSMGMPNQAMGIPSSTLPTTKMTIEEVNEFIEEATKSIEMAAGGRSPVINEVTEMLSKVEPDAPPTVIDDMIKNEAPEQVLHTPVSEGMEDVVDLGTRANLRESEEVLTNIIRDAIKASPKKKAKEITQSTLEQISQLFPGTAKEELSKAVEKLVGEISEAGLKMPKSNIKALWEYLGFKKFTLTSLDGLKRVFSLKRGPFSRQGAVPPAYFKVVAKSLFGGVAGNVVEAMTTGDVSFEGFAAGAAMANFASYFFQQGKGDINSTLAKLQMSHAQGVAKLEKAIEIATSKGMDTTKLKEVLALTKEAAAIADKSMTTLSKGFKDTLVKTEEIMQNPEALDAAKRGDLSKLAEFMDVNPVYFQSAEGYQALVNQIKKDIVKLIPNIDMAKVKQMMEDKGFDMSMFVDGFGNMTKDIAESAYAINLINDANFNVAFKLAQKVTAGTATKEEVLMMVNKFHMLATTAEVMQKGIGNLRKATRANNFKVFSLLHDAKAMTPENVQGLAEILAKSTSTSEAIRMTKFALDHPWLKRVIDIQLLSIFSSPKTWIKNAGGNTLSLMWGLATQGARTAIGVLTGEEGVTMQSYLAYIDGLIEGGRVFSKPENLKKLSDSLGYNAFKEVDPTVALHDDSVVSWALDGMKKAMVGMGKTSTMDIGYGLTGFDSVKILGLTDAFFKGILLNARAKQQIAIEYSKFMQRGAAKGLTEEALQQGGKALVKQLSLLEDPEMVKKLFDHKGQNMTLNVILNESRELAAKLGYDYDMQNLATNIYDHASYYTFTRNMRSDHMVGGVVRFINDYPLLRMIWPVLNCPLNIAHVTIQNMPFIGPLVSKEMKVLTSLSEVGTAKFSEAAAKQLMGVGAMLTAWAFAEKGLINGRMPHTRDDSFAVLSGKAKNSIIVGDQSVDLNTFGPVGNLFGLTADLLNTYKLYHRNGDEEGMEKTRIVMMGVASTIAHYMTDPGFIEGYNQLGDILTTVDEEMTNKAWSGFATDLSMRFIPQAYTDVAKWRTYGAELDNNLQFARDFTESVAQRFAKSRAKLGLYGEPLMSNNVMLGFKSNTLQFSKLHDELEKHRIPLGGFMKEREQFSSIPLSDEQYKRKSKYIGEYLLKNTERKLNARYALAPDYEKKRMLREFLTEAKGFADLKLGRDYPELMEADRQLKREHNPEIQLQKRKKAGKKPTLWERLGS